MGDLLIQNIGQIATPKPGIVRGPELRNLTVIENGMVYIREGVITAAGPRHEVLKQVDEHPEILDAEGQAVIPGFVDNHSHLVFGGNRTDEFAMRSSGMSYEEIAAKGGGILSTVQATRNASKGELKDKARIMLHKALKQGITTMEIKSGYGLDLETERKILEVIQDLKTEQPVELSATFLGAHAVPAGTSKEEYVDEVVAMIPELSGLAEFCDVFCEKGYFTADDSRKILETGLKYGLAPKIHTNQFNDIGGVKMALDTGAVSVDHLEVLSDHDISGIALTDTVATVLPGVSWFLDIPYSPARQLIDKGAIVAIATDFNPGSSMTLSMQLLMNMACTKMELSVEEALCCTTQHGAYALQKKNLGAIAPGFQADILLLDTDDYKNLAYFFGENHIHTVIKKGEKVWQTRN